MAAEPLPQARLRAAAGCRGRFLADLMAGVASSAADRAKQVIRTHKAPRTPTAAFMAPAASAPRGMPTRTSRLIVAVTRPRRAGPQ